MEDGLICNEQAEKGHGKDRPFDEALPITRRVNKIMISARKVRESPSRSRRELLDIARSRISRIAGRVSSHRGRRR